MPVRSLSSSVVRWPERYVVVQALEEWAAQMTQARPDILQIGYFGSYARGDWGVSSDLDLILIIAADVRPFWERGLDWDVTRFPVPVDLLVYTGEEWNAFAEMDNPFYRKVEREAKWIYARED